MFSDQEREEESKSSETPVVGGSTAFFFPKKRRQDTSTPALPRKESSSSVASPSSSPHESSQTSIPGITKPPSVKPEFLLKRRMKKKIPVVIPWESEKNLDFISRFLDTLTFLSHINLKKGRIEKIEASKATSFFLVSNFISYNALFITVWIYLILIMIFINFVTNMPIQKIIAAIFHTELSWMGLLFLFVIGELGIVIQLVVQTLTAFSVSFISWILLKLTGVDIDLGKVWGIQAYALGYAPVAILKYFFIFMIPIFVLTMCPFLSLLLLPLGKLVSVLLGLVIVYGVGSVGYRMINIMNILAENFGISGNRKYAITFVYIIAVIILFVSSLVSTIKVLI